MTQTQMLQSTPHRLAGPKLPMAALIITLALVIAGCSDGGDQNAASESPTDDVASADTMSESTDSDNAGGESEGQDDPVPDPETSAPAGPAPESAPDFSDIDRTVADYIEANGMNGAGLIVVDRDEGVVYENYWGEFGPDRTSLLASTSKVVSAGVLFHLADEGLLDLDAPVSEQTGWLPDNNEITVAQLLSNSSGLVGLAPNPAYGPYICQFVPMGSTADCGQGIYLSPADDLEVIEPDTEFRYGGGQWQVAGGVAEAVSGKSWNELIDEIYVEPCGLEEFGYTNHFALFDSGFDYPEQFDGDISILPTENPNIEGGAYARPGDYAKLLLMHLRGGRCGDTQVLSEASVARMQDDRVAAESFENPDRRYGYGWWVDEGERVFDPGAYGAVAWIDDGGQYGGYLVVESTGDTVRPLRNELFELVDGVMAS